MQRGKMRHVAWLPKSIPWAKPERGLPKRMICCLSQKFGFSCELRTIRVLCDKISTQNTQDLKTNNFISWRGQICCSKCEIRTDNIFRKPATEARNLANKFLSLKRYAAKTFSLDIPDQTVSTYTNISF